MWVTLKCSSFARFIIFPYITSFSVLEVNNIIGYVGDTSDLEIDVTEAGSSTIIPSEADNKADFAPDTESSVIDQILLTTGTVGLTKDLDESGDGGQEKSKEAKVYSNALNCFSVYVFT